MKQGIVKWFNTERGYGFIEHDSQDYFVHFKDIEGPGYKKLLEGERVEFEPSQSPKGRCALKVTKHT